MGTITERQRQRLRHWADRHMDEETADIFMESTPPTGWGDVATKQDLDTLSELLTARFDAKLAEEIGKVRAGQTVQMITVVVAILVAMLGNTVLPHYFPPPAPAPVSAAPIIVQVPPP